MLVHEICQPSDQVSDVLNATICKLGDTLLIFLFHHYIPSVFWGFRKEEKTDYPQICKFVLYLYLYSAQYLNVLQDSKCYMTHPTVQGKSNSQITDIPLTERQRLKDDYLSMSLRFFNLPLGIGPNDRGPAF